MEECTGISKLTRNVEIAPGKTRLDRHPVPIHQGFDEA
jgi:hypothetical protein